MKLSDACVWVLVVSLVIPIAVDVVTRVASELLRQEAELGRLAAVAGAEGEIRSAILSTSDLLSISERITSMDASSGIRLAEARGLDVVSGPDVVTTRIGAVIVPGLRLTVAHTTSGGKEAGRWVISQPTGYRGAR